MPELRKPERYYQTFDELAKVYMDFCREDPQFYNYLRAALVFLAMGDYNRYLRTLDNIRHTAYANPKLLEILGSKRDADSLERLRNLFFMPGKIPYQLGNPFFSVAVMPQFKEQKKREMIPAIKEYLYVRDPEDQTILADFYFFVWGNLIIFVRQTLEYVSIEAADDFLKAIKEGNLQQAQALAADVSRYWASLEKVFYLLDERYFFTIREFLFSKNSSLNELRRTELMGRGRSAHLAYPPALLERIKPLQLPQQVELVLYALCIALSEEIQLKGTYD